MEVIKKTLGFFWNRYVIAFSIFVVFVLILGPNNLRTQYRLSKAEADIRTERQFYLNEIEKNQKASKELMTNIDNLERFAREKYWMKRDNEDVYLIIRKDDSKKTK